MRGWPCVRGRGVYEEFGERAITVDYSERNFEAVCMGWIFSFILKSDETSVDGVCGYVLQ